MQSFSVEIKDNLTKESFKNCCIETIFLVVLLFKNYKISDDGEIEIKLEESYLSHIFEKTLSKIKIDFYKETIHSINKNFVKYLFDASYLASTMNRTELLPEKSCCRKTWIKAAFLCSGYLSNPEKNYHLEFCTSSQQNIENIRILLEENNFEPKFYQKNIESENYVLYLKKSEEITEFLALIGASRSLLELENLKIEKDLKNKIIRQINYETANIEKTVESSVKHINAIEWAIENGIFNDLPDNLKEVAKVRLENPDKNLRELCEIFPKPITKSGINHRLRRLYGIIQKEKNTLS
jgi:DNA-binding protein WhiA